MSEQLKESVFQRLMAHEDIRDKFYKDRSGTMTIGYGYTPVVMGRGGVWVVRPEVEADFKKAGTNLTEAHKNALAEIAYTKNNPKAEDAGARLEAATKDVADISLNESQAKSLFSRNYEEYYKHAERAIGKDRFDKLDEGRKSVLIEASYQSPSRINQIGPDLSKAIDAQDWGKAAIVMGRAGHKLDDVSRYQNYVHRMQDPNLRGKIEVGNGETLSTLASRYGTSVEALRTANPWINENGEMRAGSVLAIPDNPESPKPTEPPTSEAHEGDNASGLVEMKKPQRPTYGADGEAILQKLLQPLALPAYEVAVKHPGIWTEEEAKTVIGDYTMRKSHDPMGDYLRAQATDHFRQTYGTEPLSYDSTGKMIRPQPVRPLDGRPEEATLPDGRKLQKALRDMQDYLAPAFDADGMSNATKAMQSGLNLINGAKREAPRLKEDGDWGPVTDFSFKKSVASHGTGRVEEGFALGRLRALAERVQQPEELSAKTQNILGPLYGSQPGGGEKEPYHALALQGALNDLGPQHAEDWQPLKMDGEIGPKTTEAFNRLAESAGPFSLASSVGKWLGWV